MLLKWNGFRILRKQTNKQKKLWISPGYEQAAGLLGERPASPKQVNYKTMKIIKNRICYVAIAAVLSSSIHEESDSWLPVTATPAGARHPTRGRGGGPRAERTRTRR